MNERIIKDITDFIFVSDKATKADIIFLPGGEHSEVPEHGARLYNSGVAPLLMPSGKYAIGNEGFGGVKTKADVYTGKYLTECDFYCDVLFRHGVPENAVIGEKEAEFTLQNALFSRKLCEDRELFPKRAIIACKSFHARRCLMYYSFAFPDTDIAVSPVDCCGVDRNNWYKNADSYDTVMGEVRKCGDQLKEDFKKYLKIQKR